MDVSELRRRIKRPSGYYRNIIKGKNRKRNILKWRRWETPLSLCVSLLLPPPPPLLFLLSGWKSLQPPSLFTLCRALSRSLYPSRSLLSLAMPSLAEREMEGGRREGGEMREEGRRGGGRGGGGGVGGGPDRQTGGSRG